MSNERFTAQLLAGPPAGDSVSVATRNDAVALEADAKHIAHYLAAN